MSPRRCTRSLSLQAVRVTSHQGRFDIDNASACRLALRSTLRYEVFCTDRLDWTDHAVSGTAHQVRIGII